MSNDKKQPLKLLPSELAVAILQLKGKPLNLDEYAPFKLIYDCSPPKLTISAGRQIGKSVGLAGMLVVNGILRPHFVSLFISPLAQQTSRFSSAYLDAFFESPIVKKHYVSARDKKNVFEKTLNTGARIILGYAQTEQDADRIRGVASDQNFYDECQDISIEAIPIIHETMGASDYGFIRHTGTAKTENNTLNILFKASNQLEWVVKCSHCGKYNIPIDFDSCMKMIQNPDGPGCLYCGKVLNMSTGQWVAGKPSEKYHFGFHLPQLIFPARNKPKKWRELREKCNIGAPGAYSAQKVANEVFGLPSGVGGRILSIREAMACCNPEKREWDKGFPRDSRGIYMTTIGVDWSVSGSTNSYTNVSVLGYDYAGKAYLLYSQRMDGIDILEQVARVEQLYHQFECTMIGSDRGVGVLQGQLFKSHIGDEKVAMVNYVSAKNTLRWDKIGGYYAADRTQAMDTMMLKAKIGRTKLETPCWDLTCDVWQEALCIFEEESLSGKRLYRKDDGALDDWFHSIVFANIAQMVVAGNFTTVDETKSEHSLFDIANFAGYN
jgi:hypothetical protein